MANTLRKTGKLSILGCEKVYGQFLFKKVISIFFYIMPAKNELKPDEREMILLKSSEGLSVREVASITQ